MSLSARRAWIEILTDDVSAGGKIVALRKESVDRNMSALGSYSIIVVALRKESVDRNTLWEVLNLERWLGRSPQGERG